MTWPIEIGDLDDRLNLKNDRISERDADRQLRTVSEILRKLSTQPGVVLADEVGMGKTFVALGVAMMAALSDRGRRPVVVMVPSSLHAKWPNDFSVFMKHAIKHAEDKRLSMAKADSGLEFFRLIDNEAKSRPHIILLKHGAFHLQNMDHWVRLALIKRAMQGMHLGRRRDALPRFAARLLRKKSSYNDPDLFAKLLQTPNRQWRDMINNYGYCLEDNPIPEAVQKIIESDEIDMEPLRVCLRQLPARESDLIDERLERTRVAINEVLRKIWPATLAKAKFRSPLLILDEAHHLKNPATRLASLFVADDAEEDVNNITGALDGAFERMMFLTATPFQLGHHELLNVIGRFKGIAWKTLPQYSKEQFETEWMKLGSDLDRAQHSAAILDKRWQSIRQNDLVDHDGKQCNVEDWLSEVMQNPADQPEHIKDVMRALDEARIAMKAAELPLRKWVVRHLRDRNLPDTNTPRRSRLIGGAITLGGNANGGLTVEKEALLPFLLAARAQAIVIRDGEKAGRATFAEGLASSYEAFLETRNGAKLDEEASIDSIPNERVNRYVEKLAKVLPNQSAYAKHPKIAPVVECVLDLWLQGEKVVVFCHYRETGRALARHLSAALERRFWSDVGHRLGLDTQNTIKAVKDFGARFDTDGGMHHILDAELARRLAPYPELSNNEMEDIKVVVRRFLRSPLFVGRYFKDVTARSSKLTLDKAFAKQDKSGVPLSKKIDDFLKFIAHRCTSDERQAYLEALKQVQPGMGIRGDLQRDDDDDLSQLHGAKVMPNIRLANGLVRQESRRRLMLAFNTPFFPEILIASSVLAEGVDLHLHCRHIIHHDLSWNPSTLEQRTGRVDRIGAKAEVVSKSIEVFMPYIGGTQDEKQYRVVIDRERWFQVLMGEDYRTDESYTEAAAERVLLPDAVAKSLAFDLSVQSKHK